MSFNKYKWKIIKYIKYHKIGVQTHNYKIYQISLDKKYFLTYLMILKISANNSMLSNYRRGIVSSPKRRREHI